MPPHMGTQTQHGTRLYSTQASKSMSFPSAFVVAVVSVLYQLLKELRQ